MKLASYRDGSRDGQLVVVSRDLGTAHYAVGIATRLQQVLDDWNFLSPQLEALSQALNQSRARHAFAFDPRACMAPLPRAYQWLRASAFERPSNIPAQAGGNAVEPSLRHAASDAFLDAADEIVWAGDGDELDFEAGLAVATGDVAVGTAPDEALEGIRLLMLASDLTLGATHAATAFSPVAATPDELGAAWQGGRVHLNLESLRNGKRLGLCSAGPEMRFHFGELIAQGARRRGVRAGSLVGSGAVAGPDGSRGVSSIADKRALETQAGGVAKSAFLQRGDTLRIDMKGSDGQSLFGAIELRLGPLSPPVSPAGGAPMGEGEP